MVPSDRNATTMIRSGEAASTSIAELHHFLRGPRAHPARQRQRARFIDLEQLVPARIPVHLQRLINDLRPKEIRRRVIFPKRDERRAVPRIERGQETLQLRTRWRRRAGHGRHGRANKLSSTHPSIVRHLWFRRFMTCPPTLNANCLREARFGQREVVVATRRLAVAVHVDLEAELLGERLGEVLAQARMDRSRADRAPRLYANVVSRPMQPGAARGLHARIHLRGDHRMPLDAVHDGDEIVNVGVAYRDTVCVRIDAIARSHAGCGRRHGHGRVAQRERVGDQPLAALLAIVDRAGEHRYGDSAQHACRHQRGAEESRPRLDVVDVALAAHRFFENALALDAQPVAQPARAGAGGGQCRQGGERQRQAGPSENARGRCEWRQQADSPHDIRRRRICAVHRGKSQPRAERKQQRERQQQLQRGDSPEPEAHDGGVGARQRGKSPRDPAAAARLPQMIDQPGDHGTTAWDWPPSLRSARRATGIAG